MKIRNTIWKIAGTLFIIAITVSCTEDFFETEIGGRITPDKHYNSSLDAEISLAGSFVYVQEVAEKMILVDGLRSDQMNVTENADVDMINLNLHNLDANNPYIDPSNFYKIIINVNEVLPNLPQILEKDRDFDPLALKTYEGNLITLRCWAYFMLAKLNGEVGMVPTDVSAVDLNDPITYKSKSEIIDELIGKLAQFYDTEDISRYTIDHYLLMGELALEKGEYEKAASYLKYAVDGPQFRNVFTVDTDFERENWENIFLNSADNEGEVRTAIPYSFVDEQPNMLEEWFHGDYGYMVKPSDTLLRSFNSVVQVGGDKGDRWRGYGVSFDTTTTGEHYINKYSIDLGTPHSADVILYRAADIHLLLAEAVNRLGQHDLALTLLNDGVTNVSNTPPGYNKWRSNVGIRGRVALENFDIPDSVTDYTTYIEDLIMEERARELAFEGKRWFDLVRIAERRNDPAYLADKVSSKFEDPVLREEVRQKLMDPANWYLPIPR